MCVAVVPTYIQLGSKETLDYEWDVFRMIEERGSSITIIVYIDRVVLICAYVSTSSGAYDLLM